MTLHCFQYKRKPVEELQNLCHAVHYYKRKSLITGLGVSPFIVNSRKSTRLLKNLTANNAPIIFEGLHTCFYLSHPMLKNRLKIVRTHNVEHDYYRGLYRASDDLLHRAYYATEARRLKQFESILDYAQVILPISHKDHAYFSKKFPESTIKLLSPFIKSENDSSLSGKGDFILYHGNLNVEENVQAAVFLIKKVFSRINYKVVIAGKNPSSKLLKEASKYNVEVVHNPEDDQLESLMRNAHINILHTFQSTGIKLKLLNALYLGRHCLVNSHMAKGTLLENLCHIADKPAHMIELINQLMPLELSEEEILHRTTFLRENFSNKKGLSVLKQVLVIPAKKTK